MLSIGSRLIDDFIRNVLAIPFCPYHFVHTILSIPFCPYTILSIPFCPYHFVRYHFVLEPILVYACVHYVAMFNYYSFCCHVHICYHVHYVTMFIMLPCSFWYRPKMFFCNHFRLCCHVHYVTMFIMLPCSLCCHVLNCRPNCHRVIEPFAKLYLFLFSLHCPRICLLQD